MIDLLAAGATQLHERIPVDVSHVRDIESFDGALLSEFRSTKNETFLYYWCDCLDAATRWIVVRTPPPLLLAYMVGRASLRDVISGAPDGFVYLVDLDREATPQGAWLLRTELIPRNYLPAEDSFHVRDEVTQPGFQDVYLGLPWDFEEIATYPRRYLQAYAFHAAFGPGGDPRNLEVGYRLTSGYIFHHLFEKLRRNAPLEKQARLAEVAFASPGYLRFQVEPSIADGLLQSIKTYLEHRDAVDHSVRLLRAWANKRKQGQHLSEREVREEALSVCRTLGVRGTEIFEHSDSVRLVAKILTSYVSRVRFLAVQDDAHVAMLVGLTPALRP